MATQFRPPIEPPIERRARQVFPSSRMHRTPCAGIPESPAAQAFRDEIVTND
jgi:hypothetical protein